MASHRLIPLCRYRYDPLDRLIDHSPADKPTQQRFYCKNRLATEIHGVIRHSIFQHDDLILAQQKRQGDQVSAKLLATDLQRSVLHILEKNYHQRSIVYSPYGHRPAENGLLSLLGFNGERSEPMTGHYLLGNGYRAFNPTLMRFNSPDSWSPFGSGGLNSYTYCLGDSINLSDSNGHFPGFAGINKALNLTKKYTVKLLKPVRQKNASQTTNQDLSAFKRLENRLPTNITEDLAEFNTLQQHKPENIIKTISNVRDLNSLKENTTYKFIFTEQGQFTTSAPEIHYQNRTALETRHSVLTQFTSTPHIISAGEMRILPNRKIGMMNWSGHFAPSFNTLAPAAKHLRNLGATVRTFDPDQMYYFSRFLGLT